MCDKEVMFITEYIYRVCAIRPINQQGAEVFEQTNTGATSAARNGTAGEPLSSLLQSETHMASTRTEQLNYLCCFYLHFIYVFYAFR